MKAQSLKSLLGEELFCKLLKGEQETRRIALDKRIKELDHLRVSAQFPINPPKAIVTIGNGIISTPGNLTVISGESKSGKTSFCNVILAGTIASSNDDYDGFDGLNIETNTVGKAVIHIDTEQSKYHQWRNIVNGILRRVGLEKEPEWFRSYSYRPLEFKSYFKYCDEIFEALSRRFNGIHLAVIDGIADFVSSVNDEEESNRVVRYFEQLAVKYNTPIIVIIHFNPLSNKQRGHLGSQLQRKAESVLAVKRDKEISYLEPQYLRSAGNADIPLIQFAYDKAKGYYTFCGTRTKAESQESKEQELKDIALTRFVSPLSHKEAVNAIMDASQKGQTKAKAMLASMIDMGILKKEEDGRYCFALQDEIAFPDQVAGQST